MSRPNHPETAIRIPLKALEAIFDECDRYDVDETGGRIVGTYKKQGRDFQIDVLDVIGPGPNAKRSPTSFFQDGEYQERVFRQVEKDHPDLEHLGNWHTHHVNGLQDLSAGDRTTYHATVNHHKHNTDFFYALLVTRKNRQGSSRYNIKHYIFFRGDDEVHEIDDSQIHVVQSTHPAPASGEALFASSLSEPAIRHPDANLERVKDQDFFSDFYPSLQPAFSKSMGALYWKGELPLVDGSFVELLAMENTSDDDRLSYSVTITKPRGPVRDVVETFKERTFPSARHAIQQLIHDVNRELYRRSKG